MKSIIAILTTMMMSHFATASTLTSADRLKSFNCTLTSAMGITKLQYEANQKYLVKGVRNGWIPVQYQLNSAGQNHQTGNSHISLSGGGLSRNQFISLSANSVVNTHAPSTSGSVFLTTMGGSVFSPQQISSIPVGQFYCSSIVLK